MENRKNADVLRAELDLAGKQVLDVGCGEGHLTRMMAHAGAQVIGLECSAGQLEKARAYEKARDECYIDGVGENLPFEDASFDIVVFFNSLHHIPVELQAQALQEAARVLKPLGVIYISEPIASGAHFDLLKPVDDETAVRKAAYDVIKGAETMGLAWVKELTYNHPVRRKSYEEMREKLIGPNPEREKIFQEQGEALRMAFEKLSTRGEDGFYYFDQPTRVNILKKP